MNERYQSLTLKGIASLALTFTACSTSTYQQKPNIILILADDMGFSDIGCFGSEIKTPNLDSLASKGIRITQFYNASRSCPSRASLLTGLYQHQAGEGNRAVRDGEWKLVSEYDYSKKEFKPWELYNLIEDRSELDDLSSDYPDVRDELIRECEEWTARSGVVPREVIDRRK